MWHTYSYFECDASIHVWGVSSIHYSMWHDAVTWCVHSCHMTHWYVWIITNELVDRTRNFKSNASQFKYKIVKKMCRRPDFLWKKMHQRQDLSTWNKLRRRPEFLTMSWWILCPIDIVCDLFLTNHNSESSSFNYWMNEWINSLMN